MKIETLATVCIILAYKLHDENKPGDLVFRIEHRFVCDDAGNVSPLLCGPDKTGPYRACIIDQSHTYEPVDVEWARGTSEEEALTNLYDGLVEAFRAKVAETTPSSP